MIKLSEAIRTGAKLRPESRGIDFIHKGRSNVLGAAYEGVCFTYCDDYERALFDRCRGVATEKNIAVFLDFLCDTYPHLCLHRIKCPHCDTEEYFLNILNHLALFHNYTREEIAGWIEPIEICEEEQAVA